MMGDVDGVDEWFWILCVLGRGIEGFLNRRRLVWFCGVGVWVRDVLAMRIMSSI